MNVQLMTKQLLLILLLPTIAWAMPPLLDNITFVAFDTETTGFNTTDDRIIEVGAVRFSTTGIKQTTNWLINPGIPIPPDAQQVHHISDQDVAASPSFGDCYESISRFFGNALLIAHNAPFDIGFMQAEIQRHGHPMPTNCVIDSLLLFRRWFPTAPSHSLSALADHAGIAGGTFHRADADAAYVTQLFLQAIRTKSESFHLEQLISEAGGSKTIGGQP